MFYFTCDRSLRPALIQPKSSHLQTRLLAPTRLAIRPARAAADYNIVVSLAERSLSRRPPAKNPDHNRASCEQEFRSRPCAKDKSNKADGVSIERQYWADSTLSWRECFSFRSTQAQLFVVTNNRCNRDRSSVVVRFLMHLFRLLAFCDNFTSASTATDVGEGEHGARPPP